MKNSPCLSSRVVLIVLVLLGCLTGAAFAQDSKSTPLAKELVALLDQAKSDAIAAKDPSSPDSYVAALYFPGSQLLVVSAKYSVPVLLNEKLSKKDYREIYIDLNSASVPESKVFIVDLLADGLKAKRDEGQPYDTFESATKRLAFDGDWRKQKLTEEEYNKEFADADTLYAKLLQALVAEAKKG